MTHPADDEDTALADAEVGVEEHVLPCAEAMLAATLALMTGHVQACCDGHREATAKKVVEHLALLSQHADLSDGFRPLLWNLHTRWVQQVHALEHACADAAAVQVDHVAATPAAPEVDPYRVLWHTTPETLQ